jgi:hexosaminidase
MRNLPAALLCAAVALGACRPPARSSGPAPRLDPVPGLVPAPASVRLVSPDSFVLDSSSSIAVESSHPEAVRTAQMLAAIIRPSTGFALPVSEGRMPGIRGFIALRLDESRSALGSEGYELQVWRDSVRIVARQPAGLFYGVQTLRQLLPPFIESHMRLSRRWAVPAVNILDAPRFAWRGAMLDVARHFFTVDEVKQYVDLLALYKLNVFHMHLSDDQGWRIEIRSRPQLAREGGATEVGGGPGGYYTQEQFAEIVRYAAARYVTVVPEIDMPGHTNAALVAFPELSCSRRPPALYTGTEVGWSAFCPDREDTYALIDDIVREIAALTPGPYFHIGGDEVEVLTHAQYEGFVQRVQDIVSRHGKITVGWEEIGKTQLRPGTIVQNWRTDSAGPATRQGARIVASPGTRMYLDMKYHAGTELGLRWAGLIEVRDVYDWDPAVYMKGATEQDMIGLEAPLWSETIRNVTAAQYLAVPRLPALAEVAWTPQAVRSWAGFRERLGAQAPRWRLLGINYYPSPQVPWR